jgi:hypothetical protein
MPAWFRALLEWLGDGSPLAVLASVLFAACNLILGLMYRRYLLILGANRRVAGERQVYDGLRASLAEGNLAARLYADRLTRFLDWIDRFFGDAGMADRTLFPRAFWLRTSVPLWTVPAFDCCLFLALMYPIATISAIWVIVGDVGPAETALHLKAELVIWQRVGVAAAVGLIALGYWRPSRAAKIWKGMAWASARAAALSHPPRQPRAPEKPAWPDPARSL